MDALFFWLSLEERRSNAVSLSNLVAIEGSETGRRSRETDGDGGRSEKGWD